MNTGKANVPAKRKFKAWVGAARPRTLPLALSSIALGSLLAGSSGHFSMPVFLLAVLTTIFLQILSNLANDYGDSIHGADHAGRTGPARAVQTGEITSSSMLNAVIAFALFSLFSGLTLLYIAFPGAVVPIVLFTLLGLACIVAAVTYTAGKKPYGYAGLGDISVFVFFGLVGVCGTYYLHAHSLPLLILLPAAAVGLLSVGVLNVNNIRDIESDKLAGKRSIPVRIGPFPARIYHLCLLAGSIACALIYVFLNYRDPRQFMFLIITPLFVLNGLLVFRRHEPARLDPLLKQLALSTLLFVLVFGFGELITGGLPLIKVPPPAIKASNSPGSPT